MPLLLQLACSGPAASGPGTARGCVPECLRSSSCAELDAKLVAARRPLLDCIGKEAGRGRLARAHRCYRSVRLLESARWWLSTLMNPDEMSAVYQPSETIRREFLCRIEQLTRARGPAEVERLYLETVRSYP